MRHIPISVSQCMSHISVCTNRAPHISISICQCVSHISVCIQHTNICRQCVCPYPYGWIMSHVSISVSQCVSHKSLCTNHAPHILRSICQCISHISVWVNYSPHISISVWTLTRSFECDIPLTWLFKKSVMTHSHVWHDSYIRVTQTRVGASNVTYLWYHSS